MTDKRIEVYDRDHKQVVIDLGNDDKLIFTPQLAVGVAESLMHAAAACGYKVEVNIPKYQVTNALRAVLITRITLVMRSLREQNINDVKSAASIIDTILAEIC